MQAAAEADGPNEVFTRMQNHTWAIGYAFNLVRFCDARYCYEECVPDEDAAAACPSNTCSPDGNGGTVGTAGTGATGGTNGGTDTGGTAGTGGAVPVCGNGIKELGEECDPPKTAQCSDECLGIMSGRCAQFEASGACAPLANSCLTSPGTTTPEDQSACYDVSECILHTQCSNSFTKGPFTKCFCGALSDSDCAAAPETGQGSPAGPCAAVIKAGMGPGATNADVMARYTNPSYPAGAALKRYTCLDANPLSDCGILDDCVANLPCTPLCNCPEGHF